MDLDVHVDKNKSTMATGDRGKNSYFELLISQP